MLKGEWDEGVVKSHRGGENKQLERTGWKENDICAPGDRDWQP
jgi:hypothetical protein